MKQPEIILVALSNQDVALFVNGHAVVTLEASEKGADPKFVGQELAEALGVPMQTIAMEVPPDDDWGWADIAELLPPEQPKAESVKIKHWEAYGEPGAAMTHQIDIADQLQSNGQIFIDIGALEGNLDDIMGVTLEVNKSPLSDDKVPCAHIHFDGDNLAMSLFKIGDKLLVRPETNVTIDSFPADLSFGETKVRETLYWID